MMAYKICPRCLQARPYNEGCRTPACQELERSPTHLRDELEGNLHIAREQLKIGDTEHDWAAIVRDLERGLMLFDAHRGSAAYKQ